MIKNIFSKTKAPRVEGYFSCGETLLEREVNGLRGKLSKSIYLIGLLAISLFLLALSQFWQVVFRPQHLIVLHDSGAGLAWVTQRNGRVKSGEAAIRSHIANYVRMRESYAANSFSYQYRQVNQQSSPEAALAYRKEQSSNNKQSWLRVLSRQGIRKIKIDDIILLPFKHANHSTAKRRPFAEVHFTSVGITAVEKAPKIQSHTALISWGFRGLPIDPADQLTNWMGFTVYYYKVGK